ncbi:MAG: hypothetical protein M1816_001981 [Peltula sp. TS41687]|nr:MAG: hypothetical protein M1816_001981 [Peltula sp. TS41687]
MHFTTIFTSSLLLVGSALAQGQQDPYGNSGGMNMGGMNMGSRTTPAAMSASTITSTVMSVSEAAATPTDGAAGTKVHVVKVGDVSGGLIFSPDNIKAAKGDMVQFQFYPRNHSVVQSTFDKPCEPLANNQAGAQGFFSGFMPVNQSSTMQPAYSIMVNDTTKPIWFYCSQGRHCQQGMVGVINPPANNSSRTLESYKALAARAPQNLSPSQVGGGSASGSSGSVSGSSGGATTLSPSASSTATGIASNSSSTGASGSAPITGDSGVGSVRLDGGRQMVSTAAAVGFVALAVGMFM